MKASASMPAPLSLPRPPSQHDALVATPSMFPSDHSLTRPSGRTGHGDLERHATQAGNRHALPTLSHGHAKGDLDTLPTSANLDAITIPELSGSAGSPGKRKVQVAASHGSPPDLVHQGSAASPTALAIPAANALQLPDNTAHSSPEGSSASDSEQDEHSQTSCTDPTTAELPARALQAGASQGPATPTAVTNPATAYSQMSNIDPTTAHLPAQAPQAAASQGPAKPSAIPPNLQGRPVSGSPAPCIHAEQQKDGRKDVVKAAHTGIKPDNAQVLAPAGGVTESLEASPKPKRDVRGLFKSTGQQIVKEKRLGFIKRFASQAIQASLRRVERYASPPW
jgi:hypothetical protein